MSQANKALLGIFKFIPTCYFFFKKYLQAEHSAQAVIKAIIILVKTSHSQYRWDLQGSHTPILSDSFLLYNGLCALDLYGFLFCLSFFCVCFCFSFALMNTIPTTARYKCRNWSLNKPQAKLPLSKYGGCTYLQYKFWNVLPFRNVETLYRRFRVRNAYTFSENKGKDLSYRA